MKSLRWFFVLLVVCLILAGLWKFTPLQELTNPGRLAEWITAVKGQWWTPLAILVIYLAAHTVMFPNMILNAATIIGFGGGLIGWSYAMGPSLIAGTVFFIAGRFFGTERVQQIESERFEKVTSVLRRGGLLTVISVRLVPLGPFSVVNLIAGAIGIKLWHFVLGTFLAMLPGTLTMAFLGMYLGELLRDPSAKNIAIVAGVILLGVLTIAGLRQVMKRYMDRHRNAG